jgi:hypothetical protein
VGIVSVELVCKHHLPVERPSSSIIEPGGSIAQPEFLIPTIRLSGVLSLQISILSSAGNFGNKTKVGRECSSEFVSRSWAAGTVEIDSGSGTFSSAMVKELGWFTIPQ